jgi:hypothetical protein
VRPYTGGVDMTEAHTGVEGGSLAERRENPAAEAEVSAAGVARAARVQRLEHSETTLTRVIEQQTARIPSHWFLIAAMGSMALSLTLELRGEQRWSRFVGMWSHTLLIAGVYNKLVKSLGQD